MIDLSLRNVTYKIKWFDGDILDIPLPKQKLYSKVLKYIADIKVSDIEEESIENFENLSNLQNEILLDILKENKNNKEITMEDIESIPVVAVHDILLDYVSYMNDALGK